jgi:hypothetical protein
MAFHGGPLDGSPVTPDTLGQAGQGGAVDLQALLAGMPSGAQASPVGAPTPPPAGAPPAADAAPSSGDMTEGDKLGRVLADLLSVSGTGDLSEANRLKAQKAMTLIQEIKASEEKEAHDALGGKVSPRLMSKAYGG